MTNDNLNTMDCEEFMERLTNHGVLADEDDRAEAHCQQCPACRELLAFAQRLVCESPKIAVGQGKTDEIARNVQGISRRRIRGRRRMLALSCCGVIAVAIFVGQRLLSVDDRGPALPAENLASGSRQAAGYSGQTRHPSSAPSDKDENLAVVDDPSQRAHNAIMRFVDEHGNVHDVPVLVVRAPPRKMTFDELSPLERQLVRRFLELQGRSSAVTSL